MPFEYSFDNRETIISDNQIKSVKQVVIAHSFLLASFCPFYFFYIPDQISLMCY